MDKDDDGTRAVCEECGSVLEWEDCWICDGEGDIPGDEFDPINYGPLELFPCTACDGVGGDFIYCPLCSGGDD